MAHSINGTGNPETINGTGASDTADGKYVRLMDERFYRIRNFDRMKPFFMSIVSSSDLWMFVSSTGGLTAGRKNSGSALFPYYTEDKVAENSVNTGPFTILRVTLATGTHIWEPFLPDGSGTFRTERNLYKNVMGNTIVFEERNLDLGLSFRYSWRTSTRFGFVRTSSIRNEGNARVAVRFLDGLRNILPYGAGESMQNEFSCLLDAYKRNELEPRTGVGIFTLSSTMTDLAEPSESLRATVFRQYGLASPVYLLSTDQIDTFRRGDEVVGEHDIRGRRGAYMVISGIELQPGAETTWKIAGDVNMEADAVVSLVNRLSRDRSADERMLEEDIRKSSDDLFAMVAAADGLQAAGEETVTAHHFANVLFNIMRGGIFPSGYSIDTADFLNFLSVRNTKVASAIRNGELPDRLSYRDLHDWAAERGSPDLRRLCYEYLPLTFSRRHGDPSRPWNRFSISVRNPDGSRKLDYQGNWRDIFQNWEALAWSYPRFTEGMISRFLNAVTADGYNPYRITRDGFEWEKPAPSNPWANIGYWGDHQIVYLTKLLEISLRINPDILKSFLFLRIFSHANVPYRIREYAGILRDWYSTIDFDAALDAKITALTASMGTDGRLVLSDSGETVHASMAEKILILLLVKLSNFIPGGGIWMNTQRPEWNDANNALTGKGLSMVTLNYLRRFIVVVRELFVSNGAGSYPVSREVTDFLHTIGDIFLRNAASFGKEISDGERRRIMDELGNAGSAYRWNFYRNGFSGSTVSVPGDELIGFLGGCLTAVDGTIAAGRRPDGLYDSYNVLRISDAAAAVGRLQEMLEGQVAVLSSGLLSGKESLALLTALRKSRLYCGDRNSYMLYPDRDPPGFLEKNSVPPVDVEGSRLIGRLVDAGDRSLMIRDENGRYRFSGDFRNAKSVRRALDELEKNAGFADLVRDEREFILELFETTFRHEEFTGRSGTFFAYEGLGSVYWHMTAKLLLAVQETVFRAVASGEDGSTVKGLIDMYYDVRSGLGFRKTPRQFGAFPADPYSHTPSGRGAQQPGMTGQVKEEILTRMGELGISVRGGRLTFDPILLRKEELPERETEFVYIDVQGISRAETVPRGACAFTLCQVPIVYLPGTETVIEAVLADGTSMTLPGNSLDPAASSHIFDRDGTVRMLTVRIPMPG